MSVSTYMPSRVPSKIETELASDASPALETRGVLETWAVSGMPPILSRCGLTPVSFYRYRSCNAILNFSSQLLAPNSFSLPQKRSSATLFAHPAAMGIDTTRPGDMGVFDTEGLGEGEPIWDRMCFFINKRRLDVRNLMGGFDRMKKGFFDLATMRRALCNAFGNQWVELAMTQAEFNEVCEPYLTRVPLQNGEPSAMVQWRQLAQDLQMLAETGRPTADFLERLAAVEAKERASVMLEKEYGVSMDELKLAFEYMKQRIEMLSKRGLTDGFRRIDDDHKGSLTADELKRFFMEEAHCPWFINDRTLWCLCDFADLNNDDEIGFLELSQVLLCQDIIQFAALVPNKKKEAQSEKDNSMKVGSRGCTVAQVREAQRECCNALINRGSGDLRQNNVRSVLAYLDVREDGMITRDEFFEKMKLLKVLKHMTSEKKVKGTIEKAALETMLDIVDEVARKIEEQMPGDQGGAVAAGYLNLAAFAKGCFSTDGFGGFVDVMTIAGIQ